MKKVIDANYFQNPALEGYLRADKSNKVVFCEQACMETYKGDPLKNICRSLQIVTNYPRQVIVLRSTREITKLRSSSMPLSRRNLEDPTQTKKFGNFCALVQRAARGDKVLEAKIQSRGETATRYFETRRREAEGIVHFIKGIERSFHPQDVRMLRKKTMHLPEETCQRMVTHMRELAVALFQTQTDVRPIPEPPMLYKTYVFRWAVACYFLALRRISVGDVTHVNLDKLQNDMVDMHYVTCASFFDGLLSRDRRMMSIHLDTCYFLENVFPP